MFRNILRPDSPLMITMNQITDCIFLSLFWLVGCFPVITAGVSTAAMYDAVYHTFRKGEKHSWQRFAHAFRQNLKSGILPGILFLAATVLLVRLGIFAWNQAVYGNVSWGVFAAAAFLLLVLLGIGSIVFPLLSRFETGTVQLFSNAVRLGLANLPLTMGLAMVNAVVIFFCVRYVVPLCFLPALGALLSTLFIEPMLRPYMPAEEDAAE